MSPPDAPTSPAASSPGRVAVASFIGTAIEFYDFFLFGTAAALVFGKVFFPALDPTTGLLASFATFAVAFVARPLGGVLFGHVGDRVGRKTTLVASLLLMGGSTVAIGLLPSYGTIGVLAPLLLVVLRFAQGIGLGGEFGGAMLMVTEHAPPGRRGFYASLAQTGPPVGLALASVTFLVVSVAVPAGAFETWGWRIPFIASAVLVGIGLWVRLNISESEVFRRAVERREQARVPLAALLRDQPGRLLLAAGPSLLSSMLFFLITTFSLSYGTAALGISRSTMLLVIVAVVVVNAVVTPPLGALSDRVGRRRLISWGALASLLWAAPMFWLVSSGDPLVVTVAFSIGIVFYTMVFGPLGAYLPELFPTRYRQTGTSVAFNLGALGGGALAPTVAAQLGVVTGNAWWALSAYVAVMALVASACLLGLPETHTARLGPDTEPDQTDQSSPVLPTADTRSTA